MDQDSIKKKLQEAQLKIVQNASRKQIDLNTAMDIETLKEVAQDTLPTLGLDSNQYEIIMMIIDELLTKLAKILTTHFTIRVNSQKLLFSITAMSSLTVLLNDCVPDIEDLSADDKEKWLQAVDKFSETIGEAIIKK